MLFFVQQGYRAIAIDRRGHGRSSQVSDGHDMDHYAAVFGRTVHSFTNPEAAKRNMPEAIRYSPEADARAWGSALDLFAHALRRGFQKMG
jgi:pimeloyl-ACP methyl ester carboxylesterase